MITLEIYKFRCHDSLILQIKENELTLIQGESGVGKSTILDAIGWCLFGSKAVKSVSPKNENAKTSVTLKYKDLVIKRQRLPNSIKVISNGTEYDSGVAESLIARYFCSYNLWHVVGHIQQKELNGLLSSSNAVRMELLNDLTFNEDNPAKYIDKIIELLNKATLECQQQDYIVTAQKQTISQKDIRFNNYDISLEKTANEINSYITECQTAIESLNKKKMQNDVILSNITRVKQELENVDIRLKTNTFEIESRNINVNLDELRSQIGISEIQLQTSKTKSNEFYELSEKSKRIESTLKSLEFSNGEIQNFVTQYNFTENIKLKEDLKTNQYLLNNVTRDEQAINYGVNLCNLYKILYTPESIKEYIKIITKQIEIFELLLLEKDLLSPSPELQKILAQIKTQSRTQETNQSQTNQSQTNQSQTNQSQTNQSQTNQSQTNQSQTNQGQDVPLYCQFLISKNQEIDDGIKALYTEILRYEESKNIIPCPHCGKGLRKNNDKFEKADLLAETDIKNQHQTQPQNQNQACNQKINQIHQKIQSKRDAYTQNSNAIFILQKHHNALQHKILLMERFKITPENLTQIFKTWSFETLNTLKEKLSSLNTITYIEKPQYTRNEVYLHLMYYAKLTEQEKVMYHLKELGVSTPPNKPVEISAMIKTISSQINEYQKAIVDIKTSITQTENKISSTKYMIETASKAMQQREQLLYQKTYFQTMLEKHEKELTPSPIDEITKAQKDSSYWREKLQQQEAYHVYLKEKEKYQKDQKELMRLQERQGSLIKIKKLAIQAECTQLTYIVDTLNKTTNDIAMYLFDKPINIKVHLYKTLKTDQRVTPNVNVTINYKGIEFDSINALSGGERDRISLCLTLAMNQISDCPILLLDEIIGSLHEEGCSSAIKSIQKTISNITSPKTCLLVAHNAVEGVFADVIRV